MRGASRRLYRGSRTWVASPAVLLPRHIHTSRRLDSPLPVRSGPCVLCRTARLTHPPTATDPKLCTHFRRSCRMYTGSSVDLPNGDSVPVCKR